MRVLFKDRIYSSPLYREARVKASSWGAKPVPLRFRGYVEARDVSSMIRSLRCVVRSSVCVRKWWEVKIFGFDSWCSIILYWRVGMVGSFW